MSGGVRLCPRAVVRSAARRLVSQRPRLRRERRRQGRRHGRHKEGHRSGPHAVSSGDLPARAVHRHAAARNRGSEPGGSGRRRVECRQLPDAHPSRESRERPGHHDEGRGVTPRACPGLRPQGRCEVPRGDSGQRVRRFHHQHAPAVLRRRDYGRRQEQHRSAQHRERVHRRAARGGGICDAHLRRPDAAQHRSLEQRIGDVPRAGVPVRSQRRHARKPAFRVQAAGRLRVCGRRDRRVLGHPAGLRDRRLLGRRARQRREGPHHRHHRRVLLGPPHDARPFEPESERPRRQRRASVERGACH